MYWRPGKACQRQNHEWIDSVCARNSTALRWGSSGLAAPVGSNCTYQVRRARCACICACVCVCVCVRAREGGAAAGGSGSGGGC